MIQRVTRSVAPIRIAVTLLLGVPATAFAAEDFSGCDVVASTGRASVGVGCGEAEPPPQVVYVPVYVPVYAHPPVAPARTPRAAAEPTRTPRPERGNRRDRTPSPTPTPGRPDRPNRAPASERGAITFSGDGPEATESFVLEEGLAFFTLEHDGRDNFIVELLDNEGELVDLLANEIGGFTGETLVRIEAAGEHVLNVDADGAWVIAVDQEVPADAEAPPTRFDGTGVSVSPVLDLDAGLVRFRLTHDGSENFIVELYAADGEPIDLLVNEIGEFTGAQAVEIEEAGSYLLNIDADGDWTVEVE